jgi:hypothetical protein
MRSAFVEWLVILVGTVDGKFISATVSVVAENRQSAEDEALKKASENKMKVTRVRRIEQHGYDGRR